MRVLICDDSVSIARMVDNIVQSFGHETVVVHDGESCFPEMEKKPFDLVLMDVELPGINGFEVTKKLRDDYPEWFPIVFLTAKTDSDSLVKGIENGADDYLTKPIIIDILAAKIKAMERLVEMKNQLDRVNKKLARASMTDQLTDIFNRRAFNDFFQEKWQQAKQQSLPICAALIDVDHFKLYNDHYGHLQGDDCLKKVAQCIKNELAPLGVFVARFGGEEFIALFPNKTISDAEPLCQQAVTAVAALNIPHEKSSAAKMVTISLGVAQNIAFSDEDYNLLTHNADEALYKAKEQGRNQLVCFQS